MLVGCTIGEDSYDKKSEAASVGGNGSFGPSANGDGCNCGAPVNLQSLSGHSKRLASVSGFCLCGTGGSSTTGGNSSTGGSSTVSAGGTSSNTTYGCVEGVMCHLGATGGSSATTIVATGGAGTSQDVAIGGSGNTQDPPMTGGNSATGGSSAAATGGNGSSQDVGTGGGSSQDFLATGGRLSTGGSPATGGSSTSATGGGSSFDVGTGGGSTVDVSTGGKPATGGASATGGKSATGGTTSVSCDYQQYKFWIQAAQEDLGNGMVTITPVSFDTNNNMVLGNSKTTECIGGDPSCCYYDIDDSCEYYLVHENTDSVTMPRTPTYNSTTGACGFIWSTVPLYTTGNHIELVQDVDYKLVLNQTSMTCDLLLYPFNVSAANRKAKKLPKLQ